MVRRKTNGITTETVNRFLINAGAIYLNLGLPDERLLGATRDGVTYTIERDFTTPDIDGSPGEVVGSKRLTAVRPRIEASILEVTAENLKMIIAGSTIADYIDGTGTAATHDAITQNRGILQTDYIANVAIVGNLAGSNENFIGLIYNALSDAEFSIETEDTGEASIGVTFTAHFDPANMDQHPWEIRVPKSTADVTAPTVP